MTNETKSNNTILVEIDYTILDVRYCGSVSVNVDTGAVDLLGLCEDEGLWIRRDGRDVLRVIDYLKGRALFNAGLTQFYHKCRAMGYYAPVYLFVPYIDYDNYFILRTVSYLWNDKYYYIGNVYTHNYRDTDGNVLEVEAPSQFWQGLSYCDHCGCFVDNDYYNSERMMCYECEKYHVIEGYHESHNNNDSPLYFEYKAGDIEGNYGVDNFAGLGFELEVDSDHPMTDNNMVAYNLISVCGLLPGEVRYARDGSLSYGFEIISQPHTLRAFWEQAPKWENMLKYLVSKGYTSHDAGTCGLHIHVSRLMFGKTKAEQDRAIAKIFSFYNDNWQDIARASRRENFGYCERNEATSGRWENTKYLKWKKSAKYQTGHYVALNNGNRNTFEFRLGRGTLNPWSFFSWVDFTMTLCKNARRVSIDKLETNDIASWLAGIKESTAKYLYKRGAFKSICLALYPSIGWEYNADDNNG